MGAGLNSRLDWVASYPKSGNTWIRLLLGSYLDDEVVGYDDVGSFFYQCASPWPLEGLTLWQEVQLRGAALLHIAAAANSQQTIIKTHHAMCEIGGIPLFSESFVRKAVYVLRDPRNVAVSMIHHFGMTADAVVELMANPQAHLSDVQKVTHVISSWSLHVASWTQSNRVPTVAVKYERLHTDPVAELRKVVSFMGWRVSDTKIREAVDANQFEKLQAEERRHGFTERSEHADLFFRRGRVDEWRDELDDRLAREIERVHGDVMREWDYKLGPRLALAT